jgi:flagellin-like protein
MNIWGNRERSWRKMRKRAVSPIIATILLVAITVVLAAVLYILIQNYTKGTGTAAPIGTDVALGAVTNTTASGACSSTTVETYSVSVSSVNNAVPLGNLQFQVKNAAGTSVTIASVLVQNVGGSSVGTWGPSAGWSYTSPYTSSTANLATGYALVYTLATGCNAGMTSGASFGIVATTGSYSGTVSQTL